MPLPPSLVAQVSELANSLPRPIPIEDQYRFHPERFLQEILGVRLFPGFSLDWVRDAAIAWLHGHARDRYQRTGEDPAPLCLQLRPDLPPWRPGQPVQNTIILQGGAGLGKSVVAAALLVWALRVSRSLTGAVYAPIVSQAYATSWRYVDAYLTGGWSGARADLLTDILMGRKGKEGNPSIELGPLRSVVTKATLTGSTRIQGAHAIANVSGPYPPASFHLFEEADAIEDASLFDTIKTYVDKGVGLWILCLNPATATAPVQALQGPSVIRHEISVLNSPNVVQGWDVIPGASNRGWVDGKLGTDSSAWAVPVRDHDPGRGTFELPWRPGEIWEPRAPWYFRVLGKVPPGGAGDSVIPEALFLGACGLDGGSIYDASDGSFGTIGVDVAESEAGRGDRGSISRRWRGCLEVLDRPQQKDTRIYGFLILRRAEEMLQGGCRRLEIRIDAGGGFGRDVYNQLLDHPTLEAFPDGCTISLHDFGGHPSDPRAYGDWITEAYHGILADLQADWALLRPPPELRQDLCGRKLRWETVGLGKGRVDVVRLERKKLYRERNGRSPDDGDSLALACWKGPVLAGGWEARPANMRWQSPGEGGGREEGEGQDPWRGKSQLFKPPPWKEGGGTDPDDEMESALRWSR